MIKLGARLLVLSLMLALSGCASHTRSMADSIGPHFEKFQEDWTATLLSYVRQLGQHEPYVKTLLRMTVLHDTESRAEWAENHCKGFVNQFFDLKVIKRQGELRLKVS